MDFISDLDNFLKESGVSNPFEYLFEEYLIAANQKDFLALFEYEGGHITPDTIKNFDPYQDLATSQMVLAVWQNIFNADLKSQNINHNSHCFIINSPQINAQVLARDSDASYVGINAGTVLYFRILFLVIEWVWTNYGEMFGLKFTSLDKEEFKDDMKLIWPRELLEFQNDVDLWNLLNKYLNHEKLKKGNQMVFSRVGIKFCIEYFLFHELSHILCGHSKYLIQKNKPNKLCLLESKASEISDEKILFELASDRLVGQFIGQIILTQKSPFTRLGVANLSQDDFIEIWSMALAAIMSTFAILDLRDPTKKLWGSENYPHAAFRYRIIFESVSKTLSRFSHDTQLAERWKSRFMSSQLIIGKIFLEGFGPESFFRLNPGPVYHLKTGGFVEMFNPLLGFSTDAEMLYKNIRNEVNSMSFDMEKFRFQLSSIYI